MATHFSILAWEIPWTEEPGRLQSMGSKKSDMTYQLNNNNISSLEKCLFKSFVHFSTGLSFVIVGITVTLCIFWRPYPYQINSNIFSYFVGCLLMFMTVSFEAHQFLTLMQSNLFIFSFCCFFCHT